MWVPPPRPAAGALLIEATDLTAFSSCSSFCSLRFSRARQSQHRFRRSQSTSVCFSLVLHACQARSLQTNTKLYNGILQLLRLDHQQRMIKSLANYVIHDSGAVISMHLATLLFCFGTKPPLAVVASPAAWPVCSSASAAQEEEEILL